MIFKKEVYTPSRAMDLRLIALYLFDASILELLTSLLAVFFS